MDNILKHAMVKLGFYLLFGTLLVTGAKERGKRKRENEHRAITVKIHPNYNSNIVFF